MTARALLVLLLVLAGLAGCASVPESSPVQVLRRVGDGDAPVLPPGPVDGSNALDLVRDFVYASGSSPDRHGAARRFLAPEAADWDDGTGVTVLDRQFDTVLPHLGGPRVGHAHRAHPRHRAGQAHPGRLVRGLPRRRSRST